MLPARPASPGCGARRPSRRAVLGAGLAAGWLATHGRTTAASPAGVAWPARTTLLDGRLLMADAWRGQPLLVVFWATHCPFCQRHNANLHRMLQQHPESPPVLGVASDPDAATVQRYMDRHGYRFPVTLDAPAWQRALPVGRTIPTTVAVRANGQISTVFPGEMFPEDLLDLARWARQPGPPPPSTTTGGT